jgi:adenylate cyclase
MFADMVGYTALSQKDETFALQVVSTMKGLLDPIIVRHGGRIAKTMGDGFLVEFPSAMDAVLCAIEIQHAMFETPSNSRSGVQIRIGIHTGDVIHEKGDVLGDAFLAEFDSAMEAICMKKVSSAAFRLSLSIRGL